MKKIIIVLLLAFMLVGCGKKDAEITNKDDVIWKSDKETYTSTDLYELLKYNDYTATIILDALTRIGKLENIDVEAFEQEAEESVQQLIDQGAQSYIEYTYGTVDFYKSMVVVDSITSELLDKQANDRYDELKESKLPFKAEVAFFDDVETANKVHDAVVNGEHTFAYACQDNGYTSELAQTVYTDLSELPIEVKDTVLNSDKTGLTDVIQSSAFVTDANGESSITPRYYLVNIISKNADEFKEDFISYIKDQLLDPNEVIAEYLTKYDFKIYDQRTYELIKENYGEYR